MSIRPGGPSKADLSGTYPSMFAVAASPYGNGVASATAAIQAKIDAASAAGGGVVYLPPGTYVLPVADGALVPKSNVSVIGAGMGSTVLKMTGAAGTGIPVFRADGAPTIDNVVFSDFAIDGSALTGATYHTFDKGFYVRWLSRAVFQRLYIHDTPATGLGADFLQYSVIRDCVVENCGRLNTGASPGGNGIGIGVQPAYRGLVIANCIARNNARYQIFIESQANDHTKGVIIEGCYAVGGQYGIGDCGGDALQVTGCTMRGQTLAGFAINVGTYANGRPGKNGLFADNIVSDCTGDAVLVDYSSDATPGGNYTLRGNKVHDNTGYAFRRIAGAYTVDSVRIVENDAVNNTAGTFGAVEGAGSFTNTEATGGRRNTRSRTMRARRAADLGPLTASTFTQVIYDTEDSDAMNAHSTSTGAYTAVKAGPHLVGASINGLSWPSGTRVILSLRLNGAEKARLADFAAGGSTGQVRQGTAVLDLAIGDAVTVWAFASTAETIAANAVSTYFTVTEL